MFNCYTEYLNGKAPKERLMDLGFGDLPQLQLLLLECAGQTGVSEYVSESERQCPIRMFAHVKSYFPF